MKNVSIKKAIVLGIALILVTIAFIPAVNSQFQTILNRCVEENSKKTLSLGSRSWWDDSWPYRKLITIDHTKVDSNQNNFPVLIYSPTDSDLSNHAQNDGDDITFILYSDTTKLNHEIEFFDSITGKLVAWVNVPLLSSSTDTKIWMYYGNSACGSQENIEGTWNSNYVMVQHLNEPSGTLFDSTSNSNDGTNSGATFTSSSKIDGAYDFDGTNDHIDVGTFDVTNSGLTMSIWFNADSFQERLVTSGLRLISKATGPMTSDHYWMLAVADCGNKIRYRLKTETQVTSNLIVDNGGLNINTWYNVVGTYDGSYMRIYIDGVELGNKSQTGAVAIDDTVSVWIGSNPPNDYRPWDGILDEVRVSNVARDNNWISTSYKNQNNPDTFFSMGSEEVCEYTLTVNVVGNGSVTLNPSGGTYPSGTVVTLTANADPGWTFSHWSGDLSGSNNPETITMDGNKVVTAHFTQDQYTLTVNVVGNGSVTLNPSGGTYPSGTVVTLTANADPGWTFSHWSGDLSGSNNPETITMDGNKTVTATFVPGIQYTLTINIVGNGIVIKDPDNPTYPYGTVVTLTANADPGWTFSHWSGDLSGSNNPETINMTADKTVTAHFIQVQYTLNINIVGSGSVDLDPPGGTYPSGTVVTLNANAVPGWFFSHWSDDLNGSNNPETIAMDDNYTVTAHFEMDAIPPNVKIVSPENAIYILDQKLIGFSFPIIFIGVTIEVDATDNESGIERVEFYIDGELKNTDTDAPYSWIWKDASTRKHTIKVTAFDHAGNSDSQEITVWKWKFHPALIALFLFLAWVYTIVGG